MSTFRTVLSIGFVTGLLLAIGHDGQFDLLSGTGVLDSLTGTASVEYLPSLDNSATLAAKYTR